jgi:hypothetical protein
VAYSETITLALSVEEALLFEANTKIARVLLALGRAVTHLQHALLEEDVLKSEASKTNLEQSMASMGEAQTKLDELVTIFERRVKVHLHG